MKKSDIKFIWNGSFVGHTYHIEINDNPIDIGFEQLSGTQDEFVKLAVEYIKDNYSYDLNLDDIKFIWGGCL